MKRVLMNFAALTVGMSLLTVYLPRGAAQDATQDPERPQTQRPQTDRPQAQPPQPERSQQSGLNARLSKITGMSVGNQQRKKMGSVEDVVIDAKTGELRYMAISYGGFLGLGDELYAVPWQAFEFQPAEESGEYFLVLNVDQEKLKQAEGFNQDNWPDFGDREFTRKLDAHYGVDRRTDGQAREQQQQQQRDPNQQQSGLAQIDETTRGATIRSSELIGMNIRNLQDEDVGSVHDLVANTDQGKVRYMAVSYGGFLGVGDDLFAVPWKAFEFRQTEDGDDYQLVLDVNQQKLENAKGFQEDNWPNFGDREFTRSVDARYGVNEQTERR